MYSALNISDVLPIESPILVSSSDGISSSTSSHIHNLGELPEELLELILHTSLIQTKKFRGMPIIEISLYDIYNLLAFPLDHSLLNKRKFPLLSDQYRKLISTSNQFNKSLDPQKHIFNISNYKPTTVDGIFCPTYNRKTSQFNCELDDKIEGQLEQNSFWNQLQEWSQDKELFSATKYIYIDNESDNLLKLINIGFFNNLSRSSVIYLRIDVCNLGSTGIAALEPALSKLDKLKQLFLYRNNIGQIGAKFLATALSNLSNLTNLDISGNNFGLLGINTLAPALGNLSKLTSLSYYWNNLNVAGAAVFASILGKLDKLHTLSINANNLGPAGMQSLAFDLGNLTNLRKLTISENKLGLAGAVVLAPILGNLYNLTSLSMSHNDFGPEGAVALALDLGNLSNLTDLDISANDFGPEGGVALAYDLGNLSNLTYLDISNNDLVPLTKYPSTTLEFAMAKKALYKL